MFYVGAGTSGRLGILDAAELKPTFGLPDDRAIAIISGANRRCSLQLKALKTAKMTEASAYGPQPH